LKVIDGFISPKECRQWIECASLDYESLESNTDMANQLAAKIHSSLKELYPEYKLLKPDTIRVSKRRYEDENLHLDWSYKVEGSKVYACPLIVLIYLNEVKGGGPCWFPIDGKMVEPEAGKMVVIPASFMHPHKVMPYEGDRYLLKAFMWVETWISIADYGSLLDQVKDSYK
jgi:hypothetical protein